MMTQIVLHGRLAEAVGKSIWFLDVNGPGEALRAIEANTGKLFPYLRSEEGGQAHYSVIVNGNTCTAIEEVASPIPYKTIEFVPVLAGAGSGNIFLIIGLVLLVIAATIITFGAAGVGVGAFMASGTFSAWVAGTTLMLGLSLTLAGISAAMTKNPDREDPKSSPSYLFSGAVNTTNQGLPVPVGYGTLIVGSAVISVGISAEEIPVED